jgi:hypothetical protein
MLMLAFAGWFECRLATDPDPADEPRGVSGTTFACPGEPDLDRVIRFQPGPATRRPGPAVGVRITVVSRGGRPVGHPLIGAPVELAGEPRFEGRNRLLGVPGTEAIDPLEIVIESAGLRLSRRDWLAAGDAGLVQAGPGALGRRAGGGIERGDAVTAALVRATGVDDFLAYRLERAAGIDAALAATRDPLAVAALRRRREALGAVARMRVSYAVDIGELGGHGSVDGLEAGVDCHTPWPLRFWMGAWDADALCGFVSGTLGLPDAAG